MSDPAADHAALLAAALGLEPVAEPARLEGAEFVAQLLRPAPPDLALATLLGTADEAPEVDDDEHEHMALPASTATPAASPEAAADLPEGFAEFVAALRRPRA
jgi:hypothetical protein